MQVYVDLLAHHRRGVILSDIFKSFSVVLSLRHHSEVPGKPCTAKAIDIVRHQIGAARWFVACRPSIEHDLSNHIFLAAFWYCILR